MLNKDMQTEFNSVLPGSATEQGATRRVALKVALGATYAAAAAPLMAQTAITTSTEGLSAGSEVFDLEGATIAVYYARPEGKTNPPVILVLHDAFAVHAYIADICRRFAKAGYFAVAPDLFARQGDASTYTDVSKLIGEVISKVPDAQVMGDLDATMAWAVEQGGDAKKIGVTGFCWGGRPVWLYAAHSKQVKAAVAWYGRLVGTPSELTPKHPVDVAGSLKAQCSGCMAPRTPAFR